MKIKKSFALYAALTPCLSFAAPVLPLTSLGSFNTEGFQITFSDTEVDHDAKDDNWLDPEIARQTIGGLYYSHHGARRIFYGGALTLDGTAAAEGAKTSGGSGFTLIGGLSGDIPTQSAVRAHWFGEVLYQDDDLGEDGNGIAYTQSGFALTGGASVHTSVSPLVDLSATASYTFVDTRKATAKGDNGFGITLTDKFDVPKDSKLGLRGTLHYRLSDRMTLTGTLHLLDASGLSFGVEKALGGSQR